ncbi:MAG TPA: DUF1127 domain-containing protein [Burkholderiales bacterium]|jgi:uncharacterized protein YjiS (DUF1127 family)|nr:DUF1127 domain-containing protein [Burkholderiales bacterium]
MLKPKEPMNSLASIFRRMRSRWRAERARRELHALSDRTLQDIGLRRADIDPIVEAASVTPVTDGDTGVKRARPTLVFHQ